MSSLFICFNTCLLFLIKPFSTFFSRAKVVRTAIVDASSIASLMMTAEAMIADIPEEPGAGPAGPPGMPGMGGMGGMM